MRLPLSQMSLHMSLPTWLQKRRGLAGDLDRDEERRSLQLEAIAHMRVLAELDRRGAAGELSEPASADTSRPRAHMSTHSCSILTVTDA